MTPPRESNSQGAHRKEAGSERQRGRFDSRGPRAADAVAAVPKTDLAELYRFWSGAAQQRTPSEENEMRRNVLEWMEDTVDPCLQEPGMVEMWKAGDGRWRVSLPHVRDLQAVLFTMQRLSHRREFGRVRQLLVTPN